MKTPEWSTQQRALIKGQIKHYQRMLKSDSADKYKTVIYNCVFCLRVGLHCDKCPNRIMKEC